MGFSGDGRSWKGWDVLVDDLDSVAVVHIKHLFDIHYGTIPSRLSSPRFANPMRQKRSLVHGGHYSR